MNEFACDGRSCRGGSLNNYTLDTRMVFRLYVFSDEWINGQNERILDYMSDNCMVLLPCEDACALSAYHFSRSFLSTCCICGL